MSELTILRAAVERAAGGTATTVVVAGEAGIGKSRLVEELACAARDDGTLVLLGRCVDIGEGELAYAPIAGLLRSLVAQRGEDALGPARAALARLMPELDDGAAPEAGQARLFEQLLATFGRVGPVVLVVEDLQWADGSTRDFLRFLVRGADAEPIALVITCRTDELHRDDPLRPYLLELRRDARVQSVDLARFSRAELADQVEALCGAPPAPARLDRLYERSEGNPFFTEELVRAQDDQLPMSLRDAMVVQLERLPAAARRLVQVVAAAGRRVDHRLLERVAGEPDEAIRAALDARVLRHSADGQGYEFRHALLREAAYADLLPGRRAEVHGALARELEADPELGGAAFAAELAHHWHMAGERERALDASIRAGENAERVYAHPEALKHFQRALELAAAAEAFDREPLAERAAEAASAAGEAQLAIALAREAVELAAPDHAAQQHARLARLLWDAGRGREALPVSERAVDLVTPERTVARACLLESHARLLLLTGRPEEAAPVIEEALAIARERDARDVEAAVLATRVIATQDHADALVEAGQHALRTAKRHGDADTLMRAYINAAEALDHRGRVDDAIALAREGLRAARELGLERVMGVHMQGEIAGRLLRLGRAGEAATAIADGLRTAPEGAAAVALHDAAAVLGAHRGDEDAVAAETAFSRASADEAGSGQSTARGSAALAELALWKHDADQAWEIVDAALALVRESEYVWYSAPLYALGAWALADRALGARAAGEEASADAASMSASALLARLDEQPLDPGVPEPAAYRAQVAAELSRLADTPEPEAWACVRRRWERLEFPFHAAVGGWREAEAHLLADGDRGRAGALLEEAAERAEAAGATALAGEIDALARRARLAVSDGEEPPADLTPRELDVLRLMVRGHTNREIGEQLFISVKTVSVHVSRVLSKLGAANRAQAATLAHRLGIE